MSRGRRCGGVNLWLGSFNFQCNDFYLFLKPRLYGSTYFGLVGHYICGRQALAECFFSGLGIWCL